MRMHKPDGPLKGKVSGIISSMENSSSSTPFKAYLPAFLVLLVVGALGLAAIFFFTLPTIGPRWLFFFCIVLFISGLFLPVTYYLNLRFPSDPPAERHVIIRQAIWFGVLTGALAWLQIGRMLTITIAFVLAGVLVLIEVLLRLWERSRWKPAEPGA